MQKQFYITLLLLKYINVINKVVMIIEYFPKVQDLILPFITINYKFINFINDTTCTIGVN